MPILKRLASLRLMVLMALLGLVANPVQQTMAATRLDAREVFQRSASSVAMVMSLDESGRPLSLGSGFFVGEGDRLITSLHVVAGASGVRIKLSDGTVMAVELVANVDEKRDLVVLVTPTKGPPLRLSTRTPQPGDEVAVIGNPRGLEGTLSTGIVSAIRRENDAVFYQVTAPISPGSSGGPVLDGAGEVVGIATFYVRDGQNLNFATASSHVAPLLSSAPKPVALAHTVRQRERLIQPSSPAVFVTEPYISDCTVPLEEPTPPPLFYPTPRGQPSGASLQASIVNNAPHAIRNIRLVALFTGASDSSAVVHYMLIEVKATIPSGLAHRFERFDQALYMHGNECGRRGRWGTRFRLLDYEVVETAPSSPTMPTFR